MCKFSGHLRYHRDSPCQARFACSSLSGNPCGDYGLAVAVVEGGSIGGVGDGTTAKVASRVCRAGAVHDLGQVVSGDSIVVGLWRLKEVRFRAKCSLWCTSSGQVPRPPAATDDTMMGEEVKNGLVRTIYVILQLSSLVNVMYVLLLVSS